MGVEGFGADSRPVEPGVKAVERVAIPRGFALVDQMHSSREAKIIYMISV